jgi:hypothetical protein
VSSNPGVHASCARLLLGWVEAAREVHHLEHDAGARDPHAADRFAGADGQAGLLPDLALHGGGEGLPGFHAAARD